MASGLGIIGKDTFISVTSVENGAGRSSGIPLEFKTRLQKIVAKYPKKKSAIMPALYLAQEHFGWVSKEAVKWVSEELSLPPAHVESVATFYTMYYKRPVGKYHVQVCRTLSCMLCGAKDISKYLLERLAVSPGEVTSDGLWSWEEVECLGSCGTAPMIEINDVFFENLTPESMASLMDKIEKDTPDLRFHTGATDYAGGKLGTGMPEHSRSQVWPVLRSGK
jgi:NADH-quinone oxidoreductase E subunit